MIFVKALNVSLLYYFQIKPGTKTPTTNSISRSNNPKQPEKKLQKTEKRIQQLRKKMSEKKLDSLIILSSENRRYLSGFTGEDSGFDETAGLLIITEKALLLVTDSRYDAQAESEAPLFSVHRYEKELSKEIPALLKSVNAHKTGVEASRMSHEMFLKFESEISKSDLPIQLAYADDILTTLRIKKDASEINAMAEALKIAETAFLDLKKIIHAGMSEKEAAWNFEKLMREKGADALSFPVIAASGKNSALPHAIPDERLFKPNEPLLFDFGARLNGYCSDTTRTVVLGKPDTIFLEVYDVLYNAQKMAVETIRPGVKCSEIDAIARKHIDDSKFKGCFGHGLGHGVGLAIHEAPRFSKRDETLLEKGMVVTVEPGIYLPDWGGIRLENMIVVTEDGALVLNETGYEDYII